MNSPGKKLLKFLPEMENYKKHKISESKFWRKIDLSGFAPGCAPSAIRGLLLRDAATSYKLASLTIQHLLYFGNFSCKLMKQTSVAKE